jgi:hypothetical protein
VSTSRGGGTLPWRNLPYRTYPAPGNLPWRNLPYRTYPAPGNLPWRNLPYRTYPAPESLPCTYPAAAGSLQGRLPLWTLPDFPSGSPPPGSPPPPARLRAPGSLPNPRPPPTLQPPTDPRPAARRPPDRVGAVGRQDWARGRIRIFRNIRLCGKSAKSTHGKRPTLYLPWSRPVEARRGENRSRPRLLPLPLPALPVRQTVRSVSPTLHPSRRKPRPAEADST